jgi:GntR family transcriptional regulator, transcriptional repressor for pyruvate dehydrogenase complex
MTESSLRTADQPPRTSRAVSSRARFAPPARGDASEQIALEIRRFIARQGLGPNNRLGTQKELAIEFGVSRPTIREALRLLASSHLIRSSRGPGGGIFVASTPNEGMSLNLSESIATMLEADSVSLPELVEARIHLEVPLAGLAAANATDSTVIELEAAIAEAAGNRPTSSEFHRADARFHREIARTSGNELLCAFTSWTLDVLMPSLIDTIGHAVDGNAILDQHGAIARAIGRGQPANAQRAMRRHLEYVLGVARDHDPAGR